MDGCRWNVCLSDRWTLSEWMNECNKEKQVLESLPSKSLKGTVKKTSGSVNTVHCCIRHVGEWCVCVTDKNVSCDTCGANPPCVWQQHCLNTGAPLRAINGSDAFRMPSDWYKSTPTGGYYLLNTEHTFCCKLPNYKAVPYDTCMFLISLHL